MFMIIHSQKLIFIKVTAKINRQVTRSWNHPGFNALDLKVETMYGKSEGHTIPICCVRLGADSERGNGHS